MPAARPARLAYVLAVAMAAALAVALAVLAWVITLRMETCAHLQPETMFETAFTVG